MGPVGGIPALAAYGIRPQELRAEIPAMADDKEAEIRDLELRIENLLLAAGYRDVPQNVTITYLKEVQGTVRKLSSSEQAEILRVSDYPCPELWP